MTLVDEIKLLLEAPTMNARDIRTMLRQDHDEALKLSRDMFIWSHLAGDTVQRLKFGQRIIAQAA